MHQVPLSCADSGSRRTSLICWLAQPLTAPLGRSLMYWELWFSPAPLQIPKLHIRNWEAGKAFSVTASWNCCQTGFFRPVKYDGEPMCLLKLSFWKARPFTMSVVSFQGYFLSFERDFLSELTLSSIAFYYIMKRMALFRKSVNIHYRQILRCHH